MKDVLSVSKLVWKFMDIDYTFKVKADIYLTYVYPDQPEVLLIVERKAHPKMTWPPPLLIKGRREEKFPLTPMGSSLPGLLTLDPPLGPPLT